MSGDKAAMITPIDDAPKCRRAVVLMSLALASGPKLGSPWPGPGVKTLVFISSTLPVIFCHFLSLLLTYAVLAEQDTRITWDL